MAHIAVRKRQSLGRLEEQAKLKEANYVRSLGSEHYVVWQDAHVGPILA